MRSRNDRSSELKAARAAYAANLAGGLHAPTIAPWGAGTPHSSKKSWHCLRANHYSVPGFSVSLTSSILLGHPVEGEKGVMLYADVYFRRVQIEASMTKGKITLVQRHSVHENHMRPFWGLTSTVVHNLCFISRNDIFYWKKVTRVFSWRCPLSCYKSLINHFGQDQKLWESSFYRGITITRLWRIQGLSYFQTFLSTAAQELQSLQRSK